MKIMHFYQHVFNKGGVPYEARSLLFAQAYLGHDIYIVSDKNQSNFSEIPENVNFIPLESGLQSLKELRPILKRIKPDIAHFYSLWIPLHNVWAWEVKKQGIPFFMSVHGTLTPYMLTTRFGGKKNFFFHKYKKQFYHLIFDRLLIKNAKGIHALSNYEAELAMNKNKTKIIVAPNGIDPEWLNPNQKNQHKKLSLPINFLFLGRLDIYQKGLDIILEAFSKLSNTKYKNDFQLKIVGPTINDSKNYLINRSEKLKICNIEFLGPKFGLEKHRLFEETDFFLHLSRYEGMARAAREALSYGLPLIASRESNFGDWVQHYNFGITSELNPNILFKQIVNLIESFRDIPYSEFINNGLDYCHSYTWNSVAEKIINGYL